MNKPITPKVHGIVDYVFSGVQLLAPPLIGLGRVNNRTYGALASGMLAVNALSNTPAGIKKSISFQKHGKIDTGLLVGQALMTFLPFIRKNKKALAFHLVFLSLALAQYVLTDYRKG